MSSEDFDMAGQRVWHTAKFFLNATGVHEVTCGWPVDENDKPLFKCTCTAWASMGDCPHVRNVRSDSSGDEMYGVPLLPVEESGRITQEELIEAYENPEIMRNLILTHGKIMVL